MTISKHIHDLCTAPLSHTVIETIRDTPSLTPGKAYDKLYPEHKPSALTALQQGAHGKKLNQEVTQEDLDVAYQCGNWGGKTPSDLFLKIYHAALQPLEKDVRASVVSPNLMGSCGVCPLTIASIIPDIMRHYANLIVQAKHELILATNYWAASTASSIIVQAIRTLSANVMKEGRQPVVIKILYDRGNPKQVIQHHVTVDEETYAGKEVDIPRPHEIPGVVLEVVNFHVPPVGTFHAKWMVVDRRIAVLNSNNIQDVPNFEIMTHYEGPIVDSFYDMALISWNNALNPILPCIANPPQREGEQYGFAKNTDLISQSRNDPSLGFQDLDINEHQRQRQQPNQYPPQTYLNGPNSSFQRNESMKSIPADSNNEISILSSHLQSVSAAVRDYTMATSKSQDKEVPTENAPKTTVDRDATNSGGIDRHIKDGTITFDSSYEGEGRRVKAQLKTMEDVTRHLNTTIQPDTKGTATSEVDISTYSPYCLIPAHETFPIALVNRVPHGPPGHQSVHTPQNAAWLAGLRHATRSVFIQTPDLNSVPLMDDIIFAIRRGVTVTLYLCLGYNDSGELLPFQGGTNEQVVCKLYKQCLDDEEKTRLKVAWYTAKDQVKPISARTKKRTCHIKIMTIDDCVGIQGSGNQDTQSWYHSQETNVLIDSPIVVSSWMKLLHNNQNTDLYGHVSPVDGIWRDPLNGELLANSSGGDEGSFAWLKGVKGAIERVQGKGGF